MINRSELIAFYYDNYKLELTTRNAIDSRVAFSAGLAALIGGIPFYFLLNFPRGQSGFVVVLFWLIWFVGIVTLVAGGAFLASATWSRAFTHYKLLGPLNDVEEYRLGFYQAEDGDSETLDPEEKFDDYAIRQLAESCANNQDLNVKRALRWFRGTGCVLAVLVIFAIDAGPFYIVRGVGTSPVESIGTEISMPDNETTPPPDEGGYDTGGGNPVPEPPLRDTASENPAEVNTRVDEEHAEKFPKNPE